jgi:hypothetical protein
MDAVTVEILIANQFKADEMNALEGLKNAFQFQFTSTLN